MAFAPFTVAAGVDFLYIESNVGTASGGHAALRIEADVFHYQHDPEGFVALARDDWERFRTIYNDRDNRNIHVARMPFTPGEAERLYDHLVHRHLVQRSHLAFLDALRGDVEALRVLASGHPPAIPGVGLFREGQGIGADFAGLRRQIDERFGTRYLEQQKTFFEAQLRGLRYDSPDIGLLAVDPAHYAGYPETFSANYRTLASRVAALRVLAGEWVPDAAALVDPLSGDDQDARRTLSSSERGRLGELARQLEQSSLALLAAERADSGFALLLALARLGAVYRSQAQGRLLLLNPFHGRLPTEQPESPSAASLRLAEAHAQRRFNAARRAYFALEELDEASLNVLENAAARCHYSRRAVRTGTHPALPLARVVPAAARPIGVAALSDAGTRQGVRGQVVTAERHYQAFRDKVRRAYGYNLIGRNCATELTRALHAAFPGKDARLSASGAPQDAGAGLAFIPFRLYDEIGGRLDAPHRSVLPSYRNRALAAFSARMNPLWIHLAEATTLTSALYERRRGDTLFLFFTEDWPWLRPLLGMANLSYGLLHAGSGVFIAPFDHGERLSEGLRGALFSLPELVFFNIRKGSFEASRLPRGENRQP